MNLIIYTVLAVSKGVAHQKDVMRPFSNAVEALKYARELRKSSKSWLSSIAILEQALDEPVDFVSSQGVLEKETVFKSTWSKDGDNLWPEQFLYDFRQLIPVEMRQNPEYAKAA